MARQLKNKILKNSDGMSLMEVLIASTIFFMFIVSFLTGQSFNLIESSSMKEESILKNLAEAKINEVIVNPPEFKDTLTETGSKIDAKEFKDFPGYKYSVTVKKVFIPDFSKFQSKDQSSDQQVMKEIFSQFKKNMEKMVWQVRVTVENVDSGQQFFASTWMYHSEAEIEVSGF